MKYSSIQAGRGVAATLVLLFHLGKTIADPKYFNLPAFSVPFHFGSSGVEFFFVLSGFLITSLHVADFGRPNRLRAYATKRIVRIYPVYWIIFLAVYVAALHAPFPLSPAILTGWPSDAASILKCLLLLPQDPAVVGGMGAPVLGVAWTLQYEVIFYVCLGLVIVNQRLAVAALCAVGVWWVAAATIGHSSAFPLHFLLWQYLVLFGMGTCVAALLHSRVRLPAPWVLVLAGISIFLCLGVIDNLYDEERRPPLRTLAFGIASAITIYGLVAVDSEKRIRIPQWMVSLGDASYAIYLLHYPLISLFCKVAIATGLSGVCGAALAYLTILVLTFICAVAFNIYIEQPLLSWFRHRVVLRPS